MLSYESVSKKKFVTVNFCIKSLVELGRFRSFHSRTFADSNSLKMDQISVINHKKIKGNHFDEYCILKKYPLRGTTTPAPLHQPVEGAGGGTPIWRTYLWHLVTSPPTE